MVQRFLIKKTRNKFEQRIEKQIKRAKLVYTYETEKIPYVLARHYIPDFIITTPTGKIYVECKGYFRPEAKAKMVAVKKQWPSIDIRLLFYTERPQYIRWAERNGFRWAVNTIPDDWLKGF